MFRGQWLLVFVAGAILGGQSAFAIGESPPNCWKAMNFVFTAADSD